MSKIHDGIDEALAAFIARQKVFFVATAPLAGDGHLNLSPKGLDSFRVCGPRTVAYQDFIGSGIETVAHLRENGRIVILFCAFEGPPKIVRLYGTGDAVEPGDAGFAELVALFPERRTTRSIVRVHVERIADSCGYGVPVYRFEGERSQLDDWAARKGDEDLERYKRENNARNVDGLPGLRRVGS